MDIYQAANLYNERFPGVDGKDGVPSRTTQAQLMQAAVVMAEESTPPADGKFRYLEEIANHVATIAPESATAFRKRIIENPSQREFAKSLEMGFAVMDERTPETWLHTKNMTALTQQFYERQMQQQGGTPNETEMLTLMTSAMGHDMGKIGIDPKLLHKGTRVDPKRFSEAFEAFGNAVPNYPEKLHDMLFLDEANKGRVLFAKPGQSAAQGHPIHDLGKDMRRSEEYWVGDAERQRHNAIFERINALAETYLVPKQPGAWLSDEEKKTLTMPQRGTVTQQEMKAISMHDPMSEAFFRAAPLPPELANVPDIVNMDRFPRGGAAGKDANMLAEVIHTTDVFEAITGKRSYRKPYTVEEAVKVMDGMAAKGKVDPAVYNSLKASGTIEAYADAMGLEHSTDLAAPQQQRTVQTSWVDKVGGNAPGVTNWVSVVNTSSPNMEVNSRA